ncbi:hypothetical protein [Acinetobacter sp. BWR-L5]|uniref:hypothetical protein n=1 Tax=Acinetobacter sp. BWR-L5 TaxID=2815725 RepID=UPI0031FED511
MKDLQKLSPEDLSLKLMAEWFDAVSKEEFLEDFNSLGNNYCGTTIGEFLNQNKDLELNLSHYVTKVSKTTFIKELKHTASAKKSSAELRTISLIPPISSKTEEYGVSISIVHTDVHNAYPQKYDDKNDEKYALAA